MKRPERIGDPVFRRAVDLVDAGDVDGLRAYLGDHPEIVSRRVPFDGENYFRNPTLLEFSAENPVRHGTLPRNIAAAARVILEAGGKADRASIDETLALVCSGRVPRECGVQRALIDLLCDYDAEPNHAMLPALAHGEFEAVDALIRRGATVDLAFAAATGRAVDVRRLLRSADAETRHRALALAAQHGHAEIVALLLDAGEDPNRYNPAGCHSQSTPLHQAVCGGHDDTVRLLVERGANTHIKDVIHGGTPLDWAIYAGRTQLADYLRTKDSTP